MKRDALALLTWRHRRVIEGARRLSNWLRS